VPRYSVSDALVLRRSPLPSGDVVLTLLSEHGKWRAVARKGRLPGGNLARLSLFHDVTVQAYRRRDDDLAVLTQVRLNGALSGLTRPEAYPYAHVLAELTDAVTVDTHVGERLLAVVASGLRGIGSHDDPEAVALAYAWHLLELAGLAPQVGAAAAADAATAAAEVPGAVAPPVCDRCGALATRLAVDAGRMRCDEHGDHARDVWLGEDGARSLALAVRGPLRAAVLAPPHDRKRAWRALQAYVREHVSEVRAVTALAREST
jgi:DNA repair protein RecO (recombination protein O)